MEILLSKIKAIAKSTKQLAKDDPRRVIHSLKVGLALTLVSLFYYVRPLYDGFEISAMWAVLTVVVVLEFTVGKLIILSYVHTLISFIPPYLTIL